MAVRFKLEGYKHPHFIREWRKFRQLSQDQLVTMTGISKTTISRLENYGQPYSQDLLEAIAQALGCSPADILHHDPSHFDDTWRLWNSLNDRQRRRAIRLLKAITDEEENDEAA